MTDHPRAADTPPAPEATTAPPPPPEATTAPPPPPPPPAYTTQTAPLTRIIRGALDRLRAFDRQPATGLGRGGDRVLGRGGGARLHLRRLADRRGRRHDGSRTAGSPDEPLLLAAAAVASNAPHGRTAADGTGVPAEHLDGRRGPGRTPPADPGVPDRPALLLPYGRGRGGPVRRPGPGHRRPHRLHLGPASGLVRLGPGVRRASGDRGTHAPRVHRSPGRAGPPAGTRTRPAGPARRRRRTHPYRTGDARHHRPQPVRHHGPGGRRRVRGPEEPGTSLPGAGSHRHHQQTGPVRTPPPPGRPARRPPRGRTRPAADTRRTGPLIERVRRVACPSTWSSTANPAHGRSPRAANSPCTGWSRKP